MGLKYGDRRLAEVRGTSSQHDGRLSAHRGVVDHAIQVGTGWFVI
jgi:hypothetical protein